MKTRRQFLTDVGKAALPAVAMSSSLLSPALMVRSQGRTDDAQNKRIRVGIIGAENSHTIGFGKLFNVDKKFPGVEVLYVWGETDEFARNAAEKGSIPTIVKDPSEMMGKIDALIVDHRHPKFHLGAALPFVKAGIPTFVDKPFCYRVDEGKEFLKIAREAGTPVTSFSSIAQSDGTFDLKAQVQAIGDIEHVFSFGPADINSEYGGIFFYGVHVVQPLMFVFGEDVVRVRITRTSKGATASIMFESGRDASLLFTQGRDRGTMVFTKESTIKLEPRVEESDPPRHYRDIVSMFRTGKEPRSHDNILRCVAVLAALEQSVSTQEWTDVIV
jgi:predicted dehydrogenase